MKQRLSKIRNKLDLYNYRENYVYKSKNSLEFLKEIPSSSIDLVLTDPPYYINEEIEIIRKSNDMKYKYKGQDINLKEKISFDQAQWNNKKDFRQWLFKHLDEYYRILKNNKHLILFCDKRDINHIQDYGESIGFKVRQILIWQKSNPVPRARKISPMTTFETAVWLTKGKAKVEHYNWELGMVHDIIKCPIPRKEGLDERHPTQKPLFLMEVLVGLFSKPGETILDSFAGSGSTIASALVMGRKIIGNDYDPTIKEHDKRKRIFENNYESRLEYAYKILKNKVIPFFLERKSSKTKNERILELLGLKKRNKNIQDV